VTAQAQPVAPGNLIQQTAAAAVGQYELHQMASGLAGYKTGQTAAALGQTGVNYQTTDQRSLPKASGIALLDGGKAWFDRTNQVVTYKRTSARDFLIGSIVGNAKTTDTVCTVNLNAGPCYDRDLWRDAKIEVPYFSMGNPTIFQNAFVLDNTNEAQKIDALGGAEEGFSTLANSIIEAAFTVTVDDTGTAAIFSIGVASGSDATAFTNITNSLGVQVKHHDGKIYAESATAALQVSPTDTTKTYAVGTRVEVWFDMRNPASCAIYVNAVPVLTGSVFDVHTAAVDWFLIAHLVKTSTADAMKVRVDWLRQRQMEQ
jgi:hypothetical protein